MAWRVAKSLATLRDQVNKLAPTRSRQSDGTVGDTAHSSRASDHNPNSAGVVCAMDITHDPAHGFDSWRFAEMLRMNADPRISYIISNKRIANPGQPWRKYTGSNPHDHHVHVSVRQVASLYDDSSEWNLSGDWSKNAGRPTASVPKVLPLLREGSTGDHVVMLQRKLKMDVDDGIFGPKTAKAVKDFQKSKGLVADGVVGHYTWTALG